jgi:hypothetical protein
MKLTKSKLKQIIKEELTFLGALETELNFARKHGLLENEDEEGRSEEEYEGSIRWQQDQDQAERGDSAYDDDPTVALELTQHAAEEVVRVLRDHIASFPGDPALTDALEKLEAALETESQEPGVSAVPEKDIEPTQSKARRGIKLPKVTRRSVGRLQKGVRTGEWD